jgi:hypothetical protein
MGNEARMEYQEERRTEIGRVLTAIREENLEQRTSQASLNNEKKGKQRNVSEE